MKLVEWCPDDTRNRFTCYSQQRSSLELYDVVEDNGHKTTKLKAQRSVTNLTSMEWAKRWDTTQMVWGNQAGCVTLVDWENKGNECMLCAPSSNQKAGGGGGKRSCTSVSWNTKVCVYSTL